MAAGSSSCGSAIEVCAAIGMATGTSHIVSLTKLWRSPSKSVICAIFVPGRTASCSVSRSRTEGPNGTPRLGTSSASTTSAARSVCSRAAVRSSA